MSDKPAKINHDSNVPVTVDSTHLPHTFVSAMLDRGIDPEFVSVPTVAFHWKVEWEDLCTMRTADPKTMVSPKCLVVSVSEMPEADKVFNDYHGMIRVEFVTENGANLAVTHSMYYSATGEMLPLTQWIKAQRMPFIMRFGRVETRKANQFVIKPMPIDTPTL